MWEGRKGGHRADLMGRWNRAPTYRENIRRTHTIGGRGHTRPCERLLSQKLMRVFYHGEMRRVENSTLGTRRYRMNLLTGEATARTAPRRAALEAVKGYWWRAMRAPM